MMFRECGTCTGCKAKAAVIATAAEVDKTFGPMFERLQARYDALDVADPRALDALRREKQALVEERSRWIDHINKPLVPFVGCHRLVVVPDPAGVAP